MPSSSSRGPERSCCWAGAGVGSDVGGGVMPSTLRGQRAVDDLLRHVAHAGACLHGGALNEAEGLVLGEVVPVHQDLLGLVDHAPGGDLVLGPVTSGGVLGLVGLD